jgi:hypothetical protein
MNAQLIAKTDAAQIGSGSGSVFGTSAFIESFADFTRFVHPPGIMEKIQIWLRATGLTATCGIVSSRPGVEATVITVQRHACATA